MREICRDLRICVFLLIAMSTTMAPSRDAYSYDVCDNEIDVEAGERPGLFMGLELALVVHALAEKFCGGPAIPMSPKFLGFVERKGCGPGTPIYLALQETIEMVEKADLETLMKGGDTAVEISPEEVRDAAQASVDGIGGCAKVLQYSKEDLE